MLDQPATEAFIKKAFTLTYPNADATKLFQTDISWIYCTTQAPDPANPSNNAMTMFLYSVGVGYEANTWSSRLQLGGLEAWPVVRIAFA